MPGIAQQDYLRVVGYDAENDYAVYAQIAHHLELGTIFDIIIELDYGGSYEVKMRVASVERPLGGTIKVVARYDNIDVQFPIEYTSRQYEGLAAIQQAEDSDYELITLETSESLNGALIDTDHGKVICVDDKYIVPVLNDSDEIVSISLSQDSPEAPIEWVNITWEDAQKLIGLAAPGTD